MNTTDKQPKPLRIEARSDKELIRRRDAALGAIAEISDNLRDDEGMPESSKPELRHSRELFHGDLSDYWVELSKRGILKE